jgi:hypothetical protein
VGRALTRVLVERGVQPTVIELNHETAREVRARVVRAVHVLIKDTGAVLSPMAR